MTVEGDSFYVGGYWGPRSESVEDCSRRLSRFLTMLGGIHPLLASWYKTGGSRTEALVHSVDPSAQMLRELLLSGQNRRDDEARTIIPELGFSVDLWNGREPEAGLMVHCGSWAALPGATSNNVVVDLPGPQGEGLGLYDRDAALGLMRAVVEAWQPSWCVWTSRRLRRPQAAPRSEGAVGWSTYLKDMNGIRTASLPEGVTTQRLEGGLLVTFDGDAASTSEQSVSELRRALGSAVRWRPIES